MCWHINNKAKCQMQREHRKTKQNTSDKNPQKKTCGKDRIRTNNIR